MSAAYSRPARSGVSLYFAFTGFMIAMVLAGVHGADTKVGASPGDLYLISEYVLVGIGSIAYVCLSVFGERLRTHLGVPAWLYDAPLLLWTAAFAWASWHLVGTEHNRFVFFFAILQAIFVYRIAGYKKRSFPALLALCLMTWSLSAMLRFTPLKDWLVGASPGTALSALAFTFAFLVVLAALSRGGIAVVAIDARRIAAYLIAFLIFADAALRTDHLLSDWIPYHRAYFADVADLVRAGHWLLWDVPSQYGFLSVAAIAVTPGSSTWQSLYELTAILLTAQAMITFTILYHGRRGSIDYALALLLPLATYFAGEIARYPFDVRLYPQGGLRFIWTVLLIFIAFGMYVRRQDVRAVQWLRIAGYFVWITSVLWSFETATWGTITWLAYVGTEGLVKTFEHGRPHARMTIRIFAMRFLPFLIIPAITVAVLELIYRAFLGHGPDYASYIEFSSIYASDPNFHVLVDRTGPAWSLLLVLGAIGTMGVVASRTRRFEALPLIATAWLATWVSSSYWVGESFDNHVVAAYSVAIPGAAVAIYLSREWFDLSRAAAFARISLAPMAIILIASLFGEPARMLQIKAPFVPGWSFDSTRNFPVISGELARLVKDARIRPTDRVDFPTAVGWIKLDLGFILPFAKLPDGTRHQYRAWLPISPEGMYNTFESLPLDRRQTYLERYLARFDGESWYITYRESGGCALISPRLRTERSVESSNFTASLCALR